MPRKHVQRRIVESVVGVPWHILPEKMGEIAELLELRASGIDLSDADIQARIGREDSSDEIISMAGNIGVVHVHGTLFQRANLLTRYSGGTSTEQLKSALTELANDSQVKVIVLDIDSPGGTAIGNEEVVELVNRIRQSKPVYASINGLAASAAYYIASSAERIFASPSSMVGSIGTVLVHKETSAADAEAGVKFTVMRSSQYKADGNEKEPLSEQARSTLQERLVAYHNQFVDAIARGRSITPAMVETKYGGGKVFIASEALQRGMVDEIASLTQVLERFSSEASSNVTTVSKESSMSKRLRAMLFAQGLIEDIDASEDVCKAALQSWFSARGMNLPDGEDEVIAGLGNDYAPVPSEPAAAAAVASQVANGQTTVDQDQLSQQARVEERNRIAEIQAIAASIGDVPEEVVNSAIEGGTAPDEFSHQAVSARRAAVAAISAAPIQGIESEVDKFNDCAVASLMSRCGLEPEQREFGGLEGRPLTQVAHIALEVCTGVRLGRYPHARVIAEQFLRMGGETVQIGAAGTNDPAFHGSGSFPNLLSVLANKMLDRAMEYAPATYSIWTNRLPDVPDFKPATIASAGEFNHLPEHALGRPFDHSDFDEGVSWIQMKSYGNEFVLTPDMIVNDDLDAFTQSMNTRGISHELTLNRLIIDHLISDPRTADGLTMFDASHNNVISSGGAPDSAQLSEMRKLHRRQVGLSKKNKLRYEPTYVLVSPEWETQTEQTLQAVLYPQIESDANTFRGRYTAVVEPMLDETASNLVWYTIVDPSMLRGMVHAFQTGYGQGGRRRSYFQEPTQCRHFQLEGRFGTAAVNHQAIVRNPGA